MAKKSASKRASKRASKPPVDESSEPNGGARWTFLTNHAHVLIVLNDEPNIVLREVATRVGITERAVQRIVQDLEDGGFIEKRRVGRNNEYVVHPDHQLRHPIESHRQIGDLLRLISND